MSIDFRLPVRLPQSLLCLGEFMLRLRHYIDPTRSHPLYRADLGFCGTSFLISKKGSYNLIVQGVQILIRTPIRAIYQLL